MLAFLEGQRWHLLRLASGGQFWHRGYDDLQYHKRCRSRGSKGLTQAWKVWVESEVSRMWRVLSAPAVLGKARLRPRETWM